VTSLAVRRRVRSLFTMPARGKRTQLPRRPDRVENAEPEECSCICKLCVIAALTWLSLPVTRITESFTKSFTKSFTHHDLLDAASRCDVGTVADCIAATVNVNARGHDSYTPLMLAAQGDCLDVATRLLGAGADVKLRANGGMQALHMAARSNASRVLEALLRAGADPFARYSRGYTALMMAAEAGCEPCVEMLVAKGANVSDLDDDGRMAVQHACIHDRAQVVRRLLALSSNHGDAVKVIETAMLAAVAHNSANALHMLVEASAAVSDLTYTGLTPLHVAARVCSPAAAKALLEHGADPCETSSAGLLPREMICSKPGIVVDKAVKAEVAALLASTSASCGERSKSPQQAPAGSSPPAAATGAASTASSAPGSKPLRQASAGSSPPAAATGAASTASASTASTAPGSEPPRQASAATTTPVVATGAAAAAASLERSRPASAPHGSATSAPTAPAAGALIALGIAGAGVAVGLVFAGLALFCRQRGAVPEPPTSSQQSTLWPYQATELTQCLKPGAPLRASATGRLDTTVTHACTLVAVPVHSAGAPATSLSEWVASMDVAGATVVVRRQHRPTPARMRAAAQRQLDALQRVGRAAVAASPAPHAGALAAGGVTGPVPVVGWEFDGMGRVVVVQGAEGTPLPQWAADHRTAGAARGGVRWRVAQSLMADVADGLAALHAGGAVHGYLRPACVLVTHDSESGQLRAALSACTASADAVAHSMMCDYVRGVVHGVHVAPEAMALTWGVDTVPLTPEGDVWSLGSVLHAMAVMLLAPIADSHLPAHDAPATDDRHEWSPCWRGDLLTHGEEWRREVDVSRTTRAHGCSTPPGFALVLQSMLAAQPSDRPTAAQVAAQLRALP
jgi:ankyrin repeat protein